MTLEAIGAFHPSYFMLCFALSSCLIKTCGASRCNALGILLVCASCWQCITLRRKRKEKEHTTQGGEKPPGRFVVMLQIRFLRLAKRSRYQSKKEVSLVLPSFFVSVVVMFFLLPLSPPSNFFVSFRIDGFDVTKELSSRLCVFVALISTIIHSALSTTPSSFFFCFGIVLPKVYLFAPSRPHPLNRC